jgi:hypothetical protein
MEKILSVVQGICLVLFIPFGIIGSATVAENLFSNGTALIIGLFLMGISALMFTVLLVVSEIERR